MRGVPATAGRVARMRRVMPAVPALLVAGLSLLAAPQAASAAPQQAPAISSGAGSSCKLESGQAYCWGVNDAGELGDGTTTSSSVPVAVKSGGVLAGKTLTQISVGNDATCALDSAGAAYCWGSDDAGQLGNGSSAHSSVPVAVDTSGALAGKTLTQISAGDESACALDSAGIAYCWGYNSFGQLGDGSSAGSASVPVAVDTSGVLAGRTLTQIAAGIDHACALDSGGKAYCWGSNYQGGLGNGSSADSGVPVAVDTSGVLGGRTLTQVTAGNFDTCALDTAGAAYCWGANYYGGLGNGSTASSGVPVAVKTSGVLAGKTLTQITANANQTCALDSTGAAYCWGANSYGQLGNGSTANASVPVAVDAGDALAGRTLAQVTVGWYQACAVDSAGAAYCWGYNVWGQLGNGSSASSSAPVTIVFPPSSVTAVPAGTTAEVSWTAPANLGGGALQSYTATASPGGESCTTTGTGCTITGLSGLTGGVTYTITVTARTSVGNSGASTPPVSIPASDGPIVAGTHPGVCVDDLNYSSASDAPIVIWTCNGSPEQNWTVAADGTIQINGKCMDIYQEQKTNNAPVVLSTCNGGASQQWQASNGTLVNPNSGKCLDDPRFKITNGTPLSIYTCNGGGNQKWKLP